MAAAAPGDAACLQASQQFNAALGTAGVDVSFVNQFEAATAAAVTATQDFAAVSASLNLEALVAEADRTNLLAEQAQLAVENAQAAVPAALALATAEDVDGDGNPDNDPRVVEALAALTAASEQETLAVQAAVTASTAAATASADPALAAAQANLEAATAQAEALLSQIGGDAVLAQQLPELFKAFLASCGGNALGDSLVDPAIVPVATGAGVTVTAPARNNGLNVQSAVANRDQGDSAAVALISALLAVGIAVPVATAARLRRLERVQG